MCMTRSGTARQIKDGGHLFPAPVALMRRPKSISARIPQMENARSLRPLWRDLILKVWGADPLQCPCCNAPMKIAGAVKRPEQIEFFLALHGLWACRW